MRSRQLDLLRWPEIHAAQLRADQAEADWLAARRRYELAPHGEKDSRLAAFRAATRAALEAEQALSRIVEESRP